MGQPKAKQRRALPVLAYLSCRHCPEGRERAQGVANDNGGGR